MPYTLNISGYTELNGLLIIIQIIIQITASREWERITVE